MMLKVNLILLFIYVQILLINCYTINNLQRNLWSDLDTEPTDLYLAKILQMESLLQDENLSMKTSDQLNDPPRHLQKRGRQCLWKVCSWALDKRSSSSNPGSGI